MTNQFAPQFIGVDLARGSDLTFTQAGAAVQRVYIAGPMSGYADLNFPAFHTEATALRAAGLDVINPAEINVDPSTGWSACMRADIAQLVTCDRIHLLPGWSTSKGASLECYISRSLGLLVTLAEGAESLPNHFSFAGNADRIVSQSLNRAVQRADESGDQAPAAVTNVSHEAALAICEKVADYHQAQLQAVLAARGYHTEATQAHGYQYLGAHRCVEAIRSAARSEG
ncbi:DUF4406 domain-containing protein [Variovorax paradoxus]|uniref:DUF4406 domain-containing protein n=1 Tax=Variovorax paradoxus TaxID=34073 RepID=UPI003ECEA11C